MLKRNMIIIGAGPAGLTAAIYAARANLKPLVISGPQPGGQLTITSEVENFPGFPEGISGPQLMQLFRKQAERFGADFIDTTVDAVNFTAQPFTIKVEATEYTSESVIIATGASSKWLGLPREKELIGHGISSCATCDGFFFRGKDVVVVGGGDSALEEALFLTKFANSVRIIHRRDSLSGSKIMQDRAAANPKISFIWNHTIEDVKGGGSLSGLVIKNVTNGAIEEIAADGMFVAIGHQPNTGIFASQLELDKIGYVLAHEHTKTNIEGVFVAGDVHDHHYRQAITAAGFGAMAAIDAEKWLESRE
jgi:thioredoxin reductase (NADPH)